MVVDLGAGKVSPAEATLRVTLIGQYRIHGLQVILDCRKFPQHMPRNWMG
jgi:hypothetical protein